MRPEIIYWAFPEAIAEVKQKVPVALILLLSDSHKIIGEYPDLGRPASPEDNHAGDIAGIILKSERMVFQPQPEQLEVVNPEMPAAGVIRADVDILALQFSQDFHQPFYGFSALPA